MKATELKIGDWILYEGEIVKILGLQIDQCSIVDEEDSYIDTVWYDDLTPIPLTEEILEKNGWQKNDEEDWVIGISCAELILSFYQFGKEMVCSVSVKSGLDNAGLCDIKYVHQLQHILWALGLDDNLKI